MDIGIVEMRILESDPSNEQKAHEQHWLHHSNLARKWRYLSANNRKRIVLFIISIVFILLVGYNFTTSHIHLHQVCMRLRD